jgi:glycosyltransferase involved in cell wall biosynthesis
MSRPTVSICIPAYNAARYLEASLGSVLGQTLADFELVVVDDHSTDATASIVRSFTDPRLRYVRNELRLGLVGNWNRCLELARSRYVCLFHQDDLMIPDNLEAKVRMLDENPELGLVHSNAQLIGPSDEVVAEQWLSNPTAADDGVHAGLPYLRRLLTGVNLVCCPSVVARRDCYERLGGFDGRLPYTADWEMWMRIAAFHDVGYVLRPLVRYRLHEGMASRAFRGAREIEQGYRAKMLLLEKVGDRLPDAAALRARVAADYRWMAVEGARRCEREPEAGEALRYLALAREASEAGLAAAGNGQPDPEALRRWEQEVHDRALVGRFSGRDLARHASGRRLATALAFKVARRAGLARLWRLARRLTRRESSGTPPTI